MHEILRKLPPAAVVLDLGCNRGSFDASIYPLKVVRVDLEIPHPAPENFVRSSASALPFASRSVQALVSNHSLEHFENLPVCISEIARVLAPGGFIFISIPDSSTFTDRVYRWLARGGGHINQIADARQIPLLVTSTAGVKLAVTRVLCTSLSFLNRRNWPGKPPRRMWLLVNGREGAIRTLVYALRLADRFFGWRSSVYGWAYYFGDLTPADSVSSLTASNVCVGCGSASPSEYLEAAGFVTRRAFLPSLYRCPACRTNNYFTHDRWLRHL